MKPEWVQLNISCGQCGSMLYVKPDKDGNALVNDGEEVECEECHTVNYMGVDDSGCYDEYDFGTAYVNRWVCQHGADDETPCQSCDPEPIGKCPNGHDIYIVDGFCGKCQPTLV